jgi:biopolymer transport protein ExbB
MLEWFKSGGIMMYPLLLSSIMALAIIIDRFICLRRKKILIPEIVNLVEHFFSKQDIDLARNICAKYKGPLPNLIRLTLENSMLERNELKELLEDQGRQEIRELERGLPLLETIAVVSPLFGFLGTVLGMEKVFNVIKELGVGQAAALSGGIAEALITTIAGLFIGVPTLIFYNYFIGKAESYVLDIEKHSNYLVQKLTHFKHNS